MKFKKLSVIAMTLTMLLITACQGETIQAEPPASVPVSGQSTIGQVYLYGESHGVKEILDKEFDIWSDYYHQEDMRHLFVEYPYYTAEFLNLWMKSDNDDILEAVYADWAGTQAQTPHVIEFYQKIKSKCPETIFHGTDVGHQFNTTGSRFLRYLKENGMEESEQYQLTQMAIEQGKHFYKKHDSIYRENKMVENFVREIDKLNGASIMGIYGSAHTGLEMMNHTNEVPSMANQLKQKYGENIHTEDISSLHKDIDPSRIDKIRVNGKEYDASYFGKENISWFSKEYTNREIWRLENAYGDFANQPKTGNVLPYNNYPMLIEAGQVFVIDYTKNNGAIKREYLRSDDGYVWNNLPSTAEFTIE